MAAPNIVGVTTITGNTAYISLADTLETELVSNAVGSNLVYKINSIIVANDDGTNSADISVAYNTVAAGAGANIWLAKTVAVPADTTLVVLDKASSIYLEENRSIVVQASAANDLDVICSYEIIQS
jgi:hypothetical protein